jgi:hypothetical protein
MAIYSSRYNYLFTPGPQTGAQAITRVLLEQLEGEQMPPDDLERRGKIIAKKQGTTYKMIKLAELLSQDELDEAFKFSIVRNPFDLMAARYLKRAAEGAKPKGRKPEKGGAQSPASRAAADAFGAWLKEVHAERLASGTPARGQLPFLEKADFVIRYEAMAVGFDSVLQKLKVTQPIALFPEDGKGQPASTDYAALYTPDSIELVKRLHASTLEQYGYSFS